MQIAIEYIKWLIEERAKINRIPLEDIEFFENGVKLDISKEVISEFNFTGLNNIDFITTDRYRDEKVSKYNISLVNDLIQRVSEYDVATMLRDSPLLVDGEGKNES